MKLLPALLLFAALPVRADFMDGNRLFAYMAGDDIEKAVALGYVEGIFDAQREVNFCGAPYGVSAKQINDMVYQHIAATPSLRHYPANTIVTFVFRQAWPCKQQKGQGV